MPLVWLFTYKAIARMNAGAAMKLGRFDDLLSIQVFRSIAKVDGERRAQCVLRPSIWIRVYGGYLDAILRSCSSYSSNHNEQDSTISVSDGPTELFHHDWR